MQTLVEELGQHQRLVRLKSITQDCATTLQQMKLFVVDHRCIYLYINYKDELFYH